MAEVKVPALLHKMSLASQKAWYKKHGMEMPSTSAAGKSAAQAKKDVGEINKKKARETAIAAAAAASKKNKELVSSSDRVRMMRKNADMFGGGLGGGLERNRDIVNFVRSGGYIKAGRLGEEAVDEAVVKTKDINKEKLKNYVRGLGTKAVIAGKVPFDQVHSPLRAGRKALKQESATEVNEMSHGKKLAKMIMAKQSKHPIAQQMGEETGVVSEQDDTMEKKEMAETQLHFIKYAAEEILEFIKMGGEIEEWYQNKLSKVQSEVESLHSYIEGEKRRTGMVEEVKQIDEKMNLAKAKMGDVVKDFYKSKAPQFKGKSMAKRREMAVAAKLGAEREAGMREEVEQTDEAVRVVDIEKKSLPKKPDIRNRLAQAAKERRKITGEPGVKGFNKPIGFAPTKYMDTSYVRAIKKEEVEQVTEAEGKVAVTPKEKSLAAHHGDKTRITYGDVIKARLKSAAAKKMGK